MAVSVRNLGKVKLDILKFIKGKQGIALERGMERALLIAKAKAMYYTPIDTSTLINSADTQNSRIGTKQVGTLGYYTNYAFYVNDPRVEQVFRRASARKRFLERGVRESSRKIRTALIEELTK